MDLAQIEADLEELATLAPTLAPKLQAVVARVQALETLMGKVGPAVAKVLAVAKALHLV